MNPFRTLSGYALSSLALASGLALGWVFYKAKPAGAFADGQSLGEKAHLPSEAGMYRAAGSTPGYLEKVRSELSAGKQGGHDRDMAIFESRRAYNGAPPRIPHVMTDSLPGMHCLSCHAQGGWVERFQAFAPMTPHPEFTQCRQCHVPQYASSLFAASTFERTRAEGTRRAYSGAPPPIPHDLQMRENCSTCHVGPGAVKEIRSTHPERVNCMQCHVRRIEKIAESFTRAGGTAP